MGESERKTKETSTYDNGVWSEKRETGKAGLCLRQERERDERERERDREQTLNKPRPTYPNSCTEQTNSNNPSSHARSK